MLLNSTDLSKSFSFGMLLINERLSLIPPSHGGWFFGLLLSRSLLYIENPRIVRGFSKSFSVASSKSYSFRVRLDCGPSTAIKTLKEAI